MMYFKILSIVLMGVGILALQSWDTPVRVADTILLSGAALGLVTIVKNSGPRHTIVPVVFWLIAFGLYGVMLLNPSSGLESLRWGAFAVISALVAIVSTIVLMFKKPRKIR